MSGIFGASQLFFSGAGDFYGHPIGKSLRFEDGSNTYLNRTPSSTGERKTWTWSGWIKRCQLGTQQHLAFAGTASTNRGMIYLETDNTLRYYVRESGVDLGGGTGSSRVSITNAVLRDTASWYHIMVAIDTTQATDSDRTKIYINGTLQSLSQTQYPNQNTNTFFNATVEHTIGHQGYDEISDFDGYMAEINFVDGQQLNPTSFGETKSGVWIPKKYTGTYGTNGYNLEFADSSNIGEDTSGNTNNYTPNNFNEYDVMPDTPTNNFPILNAQGSRGATYVSASEGNLKVDTPNSGRGTTFSTMAMPTGAGEKYYAEYKYVADTGHMIVGVISADHSADYAETNTFQSSTESCSYTSVNGIIAAGGSTVETVATYGVGDVIGMAVDLENGTLQFSKNGSNVGSLISQSFLSSKPMLFACSDGSMTLDIRYHANFGQDSTFSGGETATTNTDESGLGTFHHTVPSGFKCLCAANLLETSITPLNDDIPEDYFESNIWTGNGTSQSRSDYEFSPDWVWIKERSSTSSHYLVDTIRGNTLFMQSNSTTQDTTNTVNVTSFDSNGFSLGSGGTTNENNQTYVGWAWKAGGTPTATNSAGAGNVPTSGSVMIDGVASTAALAGTIPVTKLSANTEAGFSIQAWTGDSSGNATIAHGLTKAPEMIIIKPRNETRNWLIWHHSLGDNDKALLFDTGAPADNRFGPNAPTSTVYGLYSGQGNRDGTTFIGYAFHGVTGYSKFGSYTGNGNADGPYIYTGFRPSYVLIKQSNTSGNNWNVHDNKRDVDNVVSARLLPSTSDAETTFTALDFFSNGFKLRTTGTAYNGSGSTYIYMTFAEMPTKYANAR